MKKIILVVVCLLATGGIYFYLNNKKDTAPALKSYTVSSGDLTVTILSTGVVQPENRLEIKPPIAGRVEEVLVKEGVAVRKGQLLAWMSSTERAALLDAARANGPEELEKWKNLYKATPVLAPINGTVISRNTEPGQTFTAQDSIFVMSDRLTIKAQVDETDIAQIKLKQSAFSTLDAYPNQIIEATVDQIAFDAKTVNNVTTYIVDVLPKQTPPFMRSGMTANVTFQIEKKSNILLIPNEAVKITNRKKQVTTLSGDKEIELGATDGKQSEVISGLSAGDSILIPQVKLRSGEKPGGSSPLSPMGGGNRRRGGSGH